MKVLVINPGATSTKVAVFEEERELLKKSIIHTAQELEGFDRVIDQAELRQRAVLEAVAEGGFRLEDFDAVCGPWRPVPPYSLRYLCRQRPGDAGCGAGPLRRASLQSGGVSGPAHW